MLDFGIARLPSSRLTIVGRVLGTPNYMAPEQILGNKSDGRADLFSVAVVFFELLVYHHPFQSSLIPRRIIDTEPDSIFDYDSNIPLPFEQIFKQALNKDPEQRYATGAHLAADLRAVLEGVRQNASPTFSSVSLPSARSLPVEPLPETPIFNEELEAGDPEEQRLSEFLRLLPYFEEAVDRESYSDARAALDCLRAIEAVDSRFVESVRICENRLATIEPAGLPSSAPSENGDSKCASCGAMNRGSAAFCFECGARRVPETTPKPPSASDLGASAEPTVLYNPVTASAKSDAPPPPAVPKPAGSRSVSPKPAPDASTAAPSGIVNTLKLQIAATSPAFRIRLAIVTGAAVAVLLILMLVAVLSKPAVQPFVATAKVGAAPAQLFEARNTSRPVASAPPGTLLNLLAKPDANSGGWLQSQWVANGKPKAQGYVRRSSLADFDSKDPDTLLQFARTEGPGESGAIPELVQQIAAYQSVQEKFPGSNAAQTASREAAKLNSALARLRDAEHPVPAEPVETAVNPATVTPASPPVTPPPASPQQDLARARRLAAGYSYDQALRALNRVLAAEPHNQEALDLRQKVKDAKDAENTVR